MLTGIYNEEKWMVYSPEMHPKYMIKRLVTQCCAKKYEHFKNKNEADAAIAASINFMQQGMFIYSFNTVEQIDKILETFAYARKRYDVTHFIIDSMQKCGLTEGGDGELASQKRFMDAICNFKSIHDCHIHLVAHPRKGKDEMIAPNKQDIKGSGSIVDLADNVLIVQRNKLKENECNRDDSNIQAQSDVFLDVAKQRNGNWEGTIELTYNVDTYQYLSSRMDFPRSFIKKYMNNEGY
jgi:twinkle protein